MEEESKRKIKARLRNVACVECAASTLCASGFLDRDVNLQKRYLVGKREEIELSWYTTTRGLFASNKHGGVVEGSMGFCSVYIPRLCPRLTICRRYSYAPSVSFKEINQADLSETEYQQEVSRRLAALDDTETFRFE